MTRTEQRLKYITLLATTVFLGYALTPGLGSLVSDIDQWILAVHINKYTSPGAILMLLNVLTIAMMVFFFDESVGRQSAPPNSAKNAVNSPANAISNLPDELVREGVAVFIFLNFNARGILAVFETINIPLFLQATGHDPSSHQAVVEASNFQFYLGCVGLLSYLAIEIFRHRFSDVTWLSFGFFALLLGNIVLSFAPAQLPFFQLVFSEVFIWSIGCPITTAVVVATFSKILGGRPQGSLMGLLGSAGSVSRMIFPFGPALFVSLTPLFLIGICLCLSSILALRWYNWKVEKSRGERDEECIEMALKAPPSPLHMQTC